VNAAGRWGALLVVLFMLIYYRAVGLMAVTALMANMLIVLAVLAQFDLVLTLPGMAGIALTVGMAVDANVLINERIREELRKDKTVRAAVEAGYQNATRTIIDANVTTLIAGRVLLWFGTGPIKGFAVTLCIGILTSMFTALVLTHAIMDLVTRNRNGGRSASDDRRPRRARPLAPRGTNRGKVRNDMEFFRNANFNFVGAMKPGLHPVGDRWWSSASS
jgi:preprotein translocase subunit SecD